MFDDLISRNESLIQAAHLLRWVGLMGETEELAADIVQKRVILRVDSIPWREWLTGSDALLPYQPVRVARN
jgi:hypothetical protein